MKLTCPQQRGPCHFAPLSLCSRRGVEDAFVTHHMPMLLKNGRCAGSPSPPCPPRWCSASSRMRAHWMPPPGVHGAPISPRQVLPAGLPHRVVSHWGIKALLTSMLVLQAEPGLLCHNLDGAGGNKSAASILLPNRVVHGREMVLTGCPWWDAVQCDDLIMESLNINYIDESEYPSTTDIQNKCACAHTPACSTCLTCSTILRFGCSTCTMLLWACIACSCVPSCFCMPACLPWSCLGAHLQIL